MSSGRPNNAGIYNFDNLNTQNLFIKGVPLQTVINELIAGDQFEQAEIDEIKQIILYLNTSGLTTEWVVGNNNINAALKTAIDSINSTVASQGSSIATNTSNISTLTTTVGTHTSNISSLTSIVSAHTGELYSQGSQITANTSAITANTNAITATNIVVGTNTSNISSQGTTIAGHTTQITNINTTLGTLTTQTGGTNTWQDYDGAVAPENLTTFTGTKVANISFAVALGNGNLDQNGLFIYKNDSNQNAQIRMETQQAKQMYIRGGSSLLLYAGDNGSVLARNLVRVGAESDHIQIGTLTDATRFPLITIGTDNALGSSTNMRGRWYKPTGISIYDGMLRASGIVGPENGLISTTTSPFFSGITVLDPLGNVSLTAAVGSITLSAVVGGIIATTTTGAIQYTTGAGAVSITTGSGAVAITTGAGNVNIASGAGQINQTTINGNIYIGAGKGLAGTAGDLQLRSRDKISISPDATTEIDKTGYIEMAVSDSAPATTTRKLYHTGGELYYSGSKVSNVKEIVGGTNITVSSSSGTYTINSIGSGAKAGLTYIITAPTTVAVTSPNFTPATDLTMSSTYTATVNRTVTLSSYANNTNYQLVSIKGLIPALANSVLEGTYELNQHVNYNGNVAASLYGKMYFFANTPASTLLINKTYTSPAGTGTVSVIYGAYVPVPANDLVLILTSVTFPQVNVNSGNTTSPLVCTVVNQSGTVLYTFPTVSYTTNGNTNDIVFTPSSSPQTITVTSAITSFRFVLTNTSALSPTLSQASAQNVNNASYKIATGSSVKMLLYDGTSNKTALTPNTQAIYALSLPLPSTPFVITDWVTPYIQLDEFFIQPSGSTTGHTCVLQFNDGSLSHLHTSIASVSSTPTLASVLVAGNNAGSTSLDMNSQNISNITTLGATTGNITTVNATTVNATTLVPTNITGWGVKSIVAGTNVTVANNSGAVTINSTALPTASGLSFIMNASSSVTNTSPLNTMTSTYTSTGLQTITRSSYSANVDYAMGEFKSNYISSSNTILSGIYLAKLYGLYSGTIAASIYSKLYLVAERATPSTQFIVDKSLTYITGNNTTNYQLLKTKPIPVPANEVSITLYQVVIPQLRTIASPTGVENITLTLRLLSTNSAGAETVQYTFPTQTLTGDQTSDRVFNVSGGSTTIDMFSLTSFRFSLTLTDDFMTSSVMRQALMRSDTDIVYKLIATTKTLLYNGTSNKTSLTYLQPVIYELNIPLPASPYDITDYTEYSKLQYEPFFIQPSGSTSGNSFVLSFNDGALSHLITSLGSAVSAGGATPTLAQVMTSGSIASTHLNMNTNNITNIGTINPNAITGWDVRSIIAGTGITASNSSGTVTIASTSSTAIPDARYFAYLSLTPNTFTNLPTTMDLSKYDYEFDFTLPAMPVNNWCYLRFNGDSGMLGWSSILIFNPDGTSGASNITSGVYNNSSAGTSIYWYNGGSWSGGSTLIMKGTYRVSAVSSVSFVVSLKNALPINILQDSINITPKYMVYTPQIQYFYSSNNLTRWAPTSIAVHTSGSYTGGNVVMREVIKSSSYTF